MFPQFSSKLICAYVIRRNFAAAAPPSIGKTKKKLGKYGAPIEKVKIPVETNAEKLVKFVCGSNIYKTGEDIELKPDSEYPEWLWKIDTNKSTSLEDMDPESKAYWLRIRKMARVRNNRLSKIKKF